MLGDQAKHAQQLWPTTTCPSLPQTCGVSQSTATTTPTTALSRLRPEQGGIRQVPQAIWLISRKTTPETRPVRAREGHGRGLWIMVRCLELCDYDYLRISLLRVLTVSQQAQYQAVRAHDRTASTHKRRDDLARSSAHPRPTSPSAAPSSRSTTKLMRWTMT
jgi:hypothetical protein